MRTLALLIALLALGGSVGATCPDFAAWLRSENEVRAGENGRGAKKCEPRHATRRKRAD